MVNQGVTIKCDMMQTVLHWKSETSVDDVELAFRRTVASITDSKNGKLK